MKEEITEQKKVRMFAPFQNIKHQQMILDEVLNEIPKHQQHRLYLYLGMMDSTISEGYSNEQI
tara:strand:- start:211 stop:399 length:189 start_codon:yes stop_codon:yes gene_type:complete